MSLLSPPSQAESDYRAVQRDYRRALRQFKDDPINRIKVRDMAREEGIDVRNITRADERGSFIAGREQRFRGEAEDAARKQGMAEREADLNMRRAEEAAAPGGGLRRAEEAEVRNTAMGRMTVTKDTPQSVGIRGPGGEVEPATPTADPFSAPVASVTAGMGLGATAAPVLSRALDEQPTPASRLTSPAAAGALGGLGGVATRSGLTRRAGTRWWQSRQ